MTPVVLTPVALACKAVVAVLLVAAGGAKLADLPGFAASVRLFLPGTTASGWPAPSRPASRPARSSSARPACPARERAG